ncbi:hypothetical protein B0H17DRAFT_1082089 [Mycena rosella]|uniref:Uncharacterized protein n=1 Tax=Mycena rosella TaxID=1033263 RepID=A0AAD7D284_MYCRO|nr:hypothetical protein B0H17DRAFT_1082089 [Mycena rosella]
MPRRHYPRFRLEIQQRLTLKMRVALACLSLCWCPTNPAVLQVNTSHPNTCVSQESNEPSVSLPPSGFAPIAAFRT